MKKINFLFLLLLIFSFASCAHTGAAQREKITANSDLAQNQTSNPPVWAGKTWAQGNSYFFSGMSSPSESLYDARQSAYSNALASVSQFLGMTISNNTTQIIGNDYSGINAQTNISSQDTNLVNGIVKDFQYSKTNDKFTGYILLEYSKQDIDDEKKRQADLEKKKLEMIAARKKIGILNVQAQVGVEQMIPALKQFLQSQGYLVGDNGKVAVLIKQISQNTERANPYSFVCFLNVEIDINGQIFTFTSRGYGSNESAAIKNARDSKQWLPIFEETFNAAQQY
jgi:hypothetical protein